MPKTLDADLVIVGAGGAGLSLLLALDSRFDALRVVLVDPLPRAGERTWCFWEDPAHPVGGAAVSSLAYRRWPTVELRARDGSAQRLDLAPLQYVMVRSAEFYDAADAAAARLGAVRLTTAVERLEQSPDGVVVRTEAGDVVRAPWVFDSRPGPPARAARTALLQHFRGWTVHFPAPLLDADAATFMDFSTPQPEHGVSFAYCLPLAADRALVEYTEFSPARLPSPAYDAALTAYLRSRWGSAADAAQVEAVEDGAIPMTDAVHARRDGRVMRLGTAGGATRPATGFTFAAMNRQAAAVADALLAGEAPAPPRPYPRRHAWMDAVLLRALDRDLTPAPELFVSLFARNPPERVLRFLDGASTLPEELGVMAGCPVLPMARAAVGDTLVRAHRRIYPR